MLTEPVYRKDYEGEIISDGRANPPERIYVKPRSLFFRQDKNARAIVIGNGKSRLHPVFKTAFSSNNKRAMPGYKITYGCNGAIWDLNCDYYVINNRLLMGYLPDNKIISQIFLPRDLFLDYKKAQMIPFLSGLDAGVLATFLACFDGHKEIYLFGFDGFDDVDNNVYLNKPCYEPTDARPDTLNNIYKLARVYTDVTFCKVGGTRANIHLLSLPNFKELDYKNFAKLGDF
jgi:hypothetical protein